MADPTDCPLPDGCAVSVLRHELRTPLDVALMASSLLEEWGLRWQDFHSHCDAQAGPRCVHGIAIDGNCPPKAEGPQLASDFVDLQRLLQVSLGNASTLLRLYGPTETIQAPAPLQRPVALRTCFEWAARLALAAQPLRDGQCEVRVAHDLVVPTDEVAWTQILTNLISNSHRHGFPSGGPQRLVVEAVRSIEGLRVRYSDNGVGLSQSARQALQGPPRPRHSRSNGGLGLRIVQSVVRDRLGGQIDFPVSADVRGFCADIHLSMAVPPSLESDHFATLPLDPTGIGQ